MPGYSLRRAGAIEEDEAQLEHPDFLRSRLS
jgi:hypothetical protein